MPKTLQLLLDTSVLISALNSSTGASAQLLHLARHRLVDVLTTTYILFETEEVIRRKFPKLLHAFLLLRNENILKIGADPTLRQIRRAEKLIDDPKDAPILAAALAHKVHYLVTLDKKDFINNQKLNRAGTSVVPLLPGDVLRLIRSNET